QLGTEAQRITQHAHAQPPRDPEMAIFVHGHQHADGDHERRYGHKPVRHAAPVIPTKTAPATDRPYKPRFYRGSSHNAATASQGAAASRLSTRSSTPP